MHVYTQLGGRSSYVEVCPILDPAPTSSGDYTQPVRVESSFQLRTRNLPEPVSWREVDHSTILSYAVSLQVDDFGYWCLVDGNEIGAPYNATDGSIMCEVGPYQVRP